MPLCSTELPFIALHRYDLPAIKALEGSKLWKAAKLRTAATLSESLLGGTALPLAGPINESEAVNSAPFLNALLGERALSE